MTTKIGIIAAAIISAFLAADSARRAIHLEPPAQEVGR